jgi:hypothetical protein
MSGSTSVDEECHDSSESFRLSTFRCDAVECCSFGSAAIRIASTVTVGSYVRNQPGVACVSLITKEWIHGPDRHSDHWNFCIAAGAADRCR